MEVEILGIGTWADDFANWAELLQLFNGHLPATKPKKPKPSIIPANECRRAPLPVRIAVEASSQAIAHSGLKATDLPCMFASGLGDTELTDYMCRELAGEHKQLSPTKFHNSVHNAAAGYWTIATDCVQPANSIAAYETSVSSTLLEGICQCLSENRPVLLAFYDIPVCQVLSSLFDNDLAFAAALVIAPPGHGGRTVKVELEPSEALQWPSITLNDTLKPYYAHNPAAKSLALLRSLASTKSTKITLPLSEGCQLSVSLEQTIANDLGTGTDEGVYPDGNL